MHLIITGSQNTALVKFNNSVLGDMEHELNTEGTLSVTSKLECCQLIAGSTNIKVDPKKDTGISITVRSVRVKKPIKSLGLLKSNLVFEFCRRINGRLPKEFDNIDFIESDFVELAKNWFHPLSIINTRSDSDISSIWSTDIYAWAERIPNTDELIKTATLFTSNKQMA